MLDSIELRLPEPVGEFFPDHNAFKSIRVDIGPEEKSGILQAVHDNCNCEWEDGKLIQPCGSLLMLKTMLEDKSVLVTHLLSIKRIADRLMRLEFTENPSQ